MSTNERVITDAPLADVRCYACDDSIGTHRLVTRVVDVDGKLEAVSVMYCRSGRSVRVTLSNASTSNDCSTNQSATPGPG